MECLLEPMALQAIGAFVLLCVRLPDYKVGGQ